jgi:hypothetical protein
MGLFSLLKLFIVAVIVIVNHTMLNSTQTKLTDSVSLMVILCSLKYLVSDNVLSVC